MPVCSPIWIIWITRFGNSSVEAAAWLSSSPRSMRVRMRISRAATKTLSTARPEIRSVSIIGMPERSEMANARQKRVRIERLRIGPTPGTRSLYSSQNICPGPLRTAFRIPMQATIDAASR